MSRRLLTFFRIHKSVEWAKQMWDTYGFDYDTSNTNPVIAWPLDEHDIGIEVLAKALDDDDIKYDTFEADPDILFA